MKRTRLARMSPTRRVERVEYLELVTAFLAAHPFCQIQLEQMGYLSQEAEFIEEWKDMGKPARFYVFSKGGIRTLLLRSQDAHHVHKRGINYLNVSTWKAVSRVWHNWIHNNPGEARKKGWLV